MDQRTDTVSTKVASTPPAKQEESKNYDKFPRSDTLNTQFYTNLTIEEAQTKAYLYPAQPVLDAFETDAQKGLSEKEAETRLTTYGENMLDGGDEISLWAIFVHQIANAMTLVLILAFAVSLGIQSWIEGGVLAFVVIVNLVVGFFQELSAEKTTSALKNLASPTARVIRSGSSITVSAAKVVPGDIVELSTGDVIPADLRLIDAMNFESDEALLTGESLPVAKDAAVAFGIKGEDVEDVDIGVGDRINLAYSSSTVTKGRATGVVIGTGMKTEIGRIADALQGAARNRKIREVKQNAHGKSLPHHYIQAGALTVYDKIAAFLGLTKGTPLQKKLSFLAIYLFAIAVLFAIVVFLANLSECKVRSLRTVFKKLTKVLFSSAGNTSPWTSQEVAIYAVATGVSMIPASLTAVLTLTMAKGAKAMVKRNVIVRKTESLEAIGGVTDICSDKTGTLTQGKMVVRRAWVPASGTYSVGESNEPFNPTLSEVTRADTEPRASAEESEKGEVVTDGEAGFSKITEDAHFVNFLNISSLCNLAKVFKDKDTQQWMAHGDPTECAIQTWACRFGWSRTTLTTKKVVDGVKRPSQWKQIAEYPFDSSIKRMSVTYHDRENDGHFAFLKGAVERVLESCTSAQTKDGKVDLTEEYKARILENMEALAATGLRVLCLAMRELSQGEVDQGDSLDRQEVEKGMTFVGLLGLYDPPRPETAGAVEVCMKAGIKVHMLTGDHPGTARAIALDVGILPRDTRKYSKAEIDSMVFTASQFDKLSDDEIDALPQLPLVVARCAPQTKVRMIQALHRRGRLCAMTGDGVNDAPSLKMADVGVAMGQAGSDVAKDASDIVLTDDNFASITNAIEEGRRMSDNIRRFVLHLLTQNVAQAALLLIGLVFKDASGFSVFPISPVSIMWVIMVSSALPAIGLGLEKANMGVMSRPPDNLNHGILPPEMMLDCAIYGLIMAALCLATFTISLYGFGPSQLGENCNASYNETCEPVFLARGATCTVMIWFSLLLAWAVLDNRRSFFRMRKDHPWYSQWFFDTFRNKLLFFSILFGFLSSFVILYVPVINDQVFLQKGISWEWAIVIITTFVFFGAIEVWKFGKRIYFRKQMAQEEKRWEQERGEASKEEA